MPHMEREREERRERRENLSKLDRRPKIGISHDSIELGADFLVGMIVISSSTNLLGLIQVMR